MTFPLFPFILFFSIFFFLLSLVRARSHTKCNAFLISEVVTGNYFICNSMPLAVCEGYQSLFLSLHFFFIFNWHWANIITYFDVQKVEHRIKMKCHPLEICNRVSVIYSFSLNVTLRLFPFVTKANRTGQKTEGIFSHRKNQQEIYEYDQMQGNSLETVRVRYLQLTPGCCAKIELIPV